MRLARLRAHTAVLATVGYVVVGLVLLGPSIRPGHTVVPADILRAVPPYTALAQGNDRVDNPIVSDGTFQFFPWVHAVTTEFQRGHVPEWNPELLGGLRMTPNGFISVYYPPSWLGRWLSPYDLYDVFVLLHLVLGALGVYALSRVIGARPLSSWLAGLLAFTAMFWVHWSLHLGHIVGMVGLPWALAATYLVLTKPTARHVAFLAVACALWWLGGNPQYVYYGMLAVGAFAASIWVYGALKRAGFLKPALGFAGGLALAAALAAPVVLSTADVSSLIARTREPPSSTVQTHLPRGDAIRILVNEARGNPPDHVREYDNPEQLMDSPFVGVTAVVLAGAAVLAAPRRRLLFVIGAAIVLVLAFTGPIHNLLYHLPGYDRFRVSARWLALLPVFVLPLAALGLDALMDGERRARWALAATAGVSLVAVGIWYLHQHGLRGAPHAYFSHRVAITAVVVIAAVAGGLLLHRQRGLAVAVLLACAVGEVLFHTPRWFPDITERTAYPAVPAMTVARERGGRLTHVAVGPPSQLMPVAPDVPMVYDTTDVQGASVLFPKSYDRYLRLISDYGTFVAEQNVAPAFPPRVVGSPLLDALDVRTVVSAVELPASGLRLVDSSGGVYVYERPSPGPALLVPAAEPATEASMWQRVADPRWDPRQTTAVLGLPHPISGGPGRVDRTASSNDGDSWDVDAPSGGFLRVSGNDDPGWHASIDGRSVEVHRADGIFRGVAVPPGHHRVDFSYTNPAERTGRTVSVLALVCLVGLVMWPSARRLRSGTRSASDAGTAGMSGAARPAPSAPRDG